jgi:tetratricopeptide (TPR) repeat protein
MGSLQMLNAEYELAEDSLRRSVEAEPSAEALNDLAWLLQTRGELDEAEEMARASLSANGKLGPAWDTLGMILLRKGRPDEARQAMEKALELVPDSLLSQLHLAQVLAAADQPGAAKAIVVRLLPDAAMLPPESQDELVALQSALGLE